MRVKICIVIEQNQAILKQPPLQSLIQIASLKCDTDDYGGGGENYAAPRRLRSLAAESAEAGNAKAGGEVGAVAEADEGGGGGGGGVVVVESADVADNSKVRDDQTPTPRSRKRDAIMKNLFGRGIK